MTGASGTGAGTRFWADGEPLRAEVWSCPAFASSAASEFLADLEGLDEDAEEFVDD